jgi:hypothetical protein
MYRRSLVTELPQWFYKMLAPDWCLLIMFAQHGKIGYVDVVMGVYRRHKGGRWSGKDSIQRLVGTLEAYECLNPFFDYRYENIIQPSVVKILNELSSCLVDEVADGETIQMACGRALAMVAKWADKFALPENLRREIRAELYSYLVFDRFRKRDLQTVRYSFPRAIQLRPKLLQNRGAVSIGIQALLERPMAAWPWRRK